MGTSTAMRMASAALVAALVLVSGCDGAAVRPAPTAAEPSEVAQPQLTADATLPSASADDVWVPVVDEPTGVTVQMPGEATSEALEAPDGAGGTVPLRSYIASAGERQHAVSFSVTDIPPGQEAVAPEDRLEPSLQGAAANTGATIESQSTASAGAYPALDGVLIFTQGGTAGVSLMRVAATDTAVVIVQTVGRASDRAELETLQQRLASSLVIP